MIKRGYVWILKSCMQFLKKLAIMEPHYLCIWCLISSSVVWSVWTCWHHFWKGFTPVLCVESHYLEGGSGRRFGKNSSMFQNLDSFYTSFKQCFFLNFLILQKWKSFHMFTQFIRVFLKLFCQSSTIFLEFSTKISKCRHSQLFGWLLTMLPVFFSPILWCTWSGDHLQDDLARFGHKKRKLKI